jgi:competence protein ComEC
LLFVSLSSFGSGATQPFVLVTSSPDNVTVYFFDVGQGDSMLIEAVGKYVLIDGGPRSAGSTLLNYLNIYNVTKIDLLIASHPHEDHIGGLIPVIQSIPVDVIYNGVNYSSQVFKDFLALASTFNLTIAYRSQVYALSPTVNFTVLNPAQPLEFTDNNANSIVLRLQVGNTSVLLTGDATIASEQSMLSTDFNLNSQILKVGHHGSKTSTSEVFLTSIDPSYAVISAGVNNRYDHPAQEILNRLTDKSITIYGTYSQGTIVFELTSYMSYTSPLPSPTSGQKSKMPEIPESTLLILVVIAGGVSLSLLVLKRKRL